VGINGFGRIGRNFWRAANAVDGDRGIEIVAANDLGDIATMAHLLKYDTVLGTLADDVSVSGDTIRAGDQSIKILAEREPARLPWRDLGVDIVLESTGRFTTGPAARAHLEAGAKKVIISAPAKEEDITIVMGVNDDAYDPAVHDILSNASCTTNAGRGPRRRTSSRPRPGRPRRPRWCCRNSRASWMGWPCGCPCPTARSPT
jgi:glyceraldehyde 3-phosphate dehydrogenase